jgi:hypothetical protein
MNKIGIMDGISLKKLSLKQLKKKFDLREFAIPEIQRLYVWNKPKICSLMDSIYKGYPIGIGLVWAAKYSQAINIRPNNKTIIPPYNRRLKHAELIIDGQQRLSTLFGVLFGIEERAEARSFINFNEIYFVCDRKAEKRFIFSKRISEDTKGYVRLTNLVNTPPSILKQRLKLSPGEVREVQKCYSAFHSYPFYLLQVSGLSYDDIREIFIRVNSAGITVSRADTLFAKASKVKLRDHMLDVRRGLKHGFDSVSLDAFQNTLGLAYGASRIGGAGFSNFLKKIEEGKSSSSDFERHWKKLQYGYEEAADFFFSVLGIKGSELPSQNIYSMLSYFFYLNNSRAKPFQIKELKKWFWHTAVGERYSGAGFNRNIPDDVKFLKRLSENSKTRYSVSEKILPREFLISGYNKSTSASAKSYFVLLRLRKPKYLINGHEMLMNDFSSISNRKDRHHIYPFALLRRKGISLRWINAVVNICYLEADENQSISDGHPKDYLLPYKSNKHFGRVMKSHLIPYDKASPVWEREVKQSFSKFVNIRGRMLIASIEQMAGTTLFEKFDAIRVN